MAEDPNERYDRLYKENMDAFEREIYGECDREGCTKPYCRDGDICGKES